MSLPLGLMTLLKNIAKFLEKWRSILFLTIAIVLFAGAILIRIPLPAAVLYNADSWGYVGPAFIHTETGYFPQAHGRNFFYPALLHLVLLPADNTTHIVIWQHSLGVVAGMLWLLLWMLWTRQLPAGWLRNWASPLVGLVCTFVFLFNGMGLIFEHHIRPEGVFPFFAILQLLFLSGTLRAGMHGKNASRIVILAALTAVAALAAVALKPSWTLTLGTLPLLLIVTIIATRGYRSVLAMLFGICLGAIAWSAGMQLWKGALKWQADPSAKLFLSKSLVSVHANLILEKETSDVTTASFLAELSDAFEQSRLEVKSYRLLGFNPDTIFYQTPVFENLPGTIDENHRFLMGLYLNTLKTNPVAMSHKWLRQFAATMQPMRNCVFRRDYQLSRDYERSAAELRARAQCEALAVASRLESEAQKAQMVATTLDERTPLTINLNGDFIDIFRLLVPIGVVSSLCTGMIMLFRRDSPWRTCALEGFLWCATFLSAIAAVAIVHSFDIDRYGEILNFLYLLMAGFAAIVLLTVPTALLHRWGGRVRKSRNHQVHEPI